VIGRDPTPKLYAQGTRIDMSNECQVMVMSGLGRYAAYLEAVWQIGCVGYYIAARTD
jgi:hypothetical protein